MLHGDYARFRRMLEVMVRTFDANELPTGSLDAADVVTGVQRDLGDKKKLSKS